MYRDQMYGAKQDNRTSERPKEIACKLIATKPQSEELDPGLRKRSRPKTKSAPKAKLSSGQISDQIFSFEKIR